jgi:hypothetical protein
MIMLKAISLIGDQNILLFSPHKDQTLINIRPLTSTSMQRKESCFRSYASKLDDFLTKSKLKSTSNKKDLFSRQRKRKSNVDSLVESMRCSPTAAPLQETYSHNFATLNSTKRGMYVV